MKKFITTAAVAVALFGQAQVPTAGLIDRWEFSGVYTTGNGFGTTNMGTPPKLPTFVQDRCGESDKAVHFDGVDDFLEYKLPAASVPINTADRSVSFWMRTNNTTT